MKYGSDDIDEFQTYGAEVLKAPGTIYLYLKYNSLFSDSIKKCLCAKLPAGQAPGIRQYSCGDKHPGSHTLETEVLLPPTSDQLQPGPALQKL